jgi:SsrA-binding protein
MAAKAGKGTKNPDAEGRKVVVSNRRARHDYEILDTYEAGIVLQGSEVKALRSGHGNLQDSFARLEGGEVWLYGMHVQPWQFAGPRAPDPDRRRKLLLHRAEIDRLIGTIKQEGLTLVPLQVYFFGGLAKVEIGLAKGRRKYDKRQVLAERDAKRDVERELRRRR